LSAGTRWTASPPARLVESNGIVSRCPASGRTSIRRSSALSLPLSPASTTDESISPQSASRDQLPGSDRTGRPAAVSRAETERGARCSRRGTQRNPARKTRCHSRRRPRTKARRCRPSARTTDLGRLPLRLQAAAEGPSADYADSSISGTFASWGMKLLLGGRVRARRYGRRIGARGLLGERRVGQAGSLDDGRRARASQLVAPATCEVAVRAARSIRVTRT
jgi:hypothetical protein